MAELAKIRWWQWLPLLPWRIVAVVDSADGVPQRLPRNGAVLVGPRTQPKWIAFDCPCHTGHRIMLNTDLARSPHWSTTGHGPLTIFPSIDSAARSRRCHYFIRKGRTQWVHNDNT